MTRRWMRGLWGAIFIAGSLPGCTGVPVNLNEYGQGSYDPTTGREISIRGCGLQLFDLIPIATNNRQVRAYRALARMAPNSVITDVRIKERWYWAYIGNIYCTRMTATAYRRR